MKNIVRAAAAIALAGVLSTPAMARPHHPPPPPVTTIHFHGGSVGFIVGVGGASGYVKFHGERYPIDVSGLKVGTIGVTSYDVDGRVYNLRRISDIEGGYASGEASATVGGGGGGLDMTNGNGVEIRATSTSSGLQLTLGPGGVTITLKH
jgi:outer membrane immunogenic protein